MKKRRFLTFLCLVVQACHTSDASTGAAEATIKVENAPSAVVNAAVAHKTAVAPEIASCAHDPRVMALETPVVVQGALSQYTFHILKTTPQVLSRGMNRLTIEVRRGHNVAREVASLAITPTMPDHGHGAQTVPQVHGKNGRFRVDAVDLFMPGVWRIGVRANNAKTETLETGAFYFCIEG